MTVEAALLDEICAAPDRDEPRLVYADWLEQQGDPRGELIHAQCTPGGEARAEELLAQYRDLWARPLRPIWEELSHPPRFERGFIIEVYLMGTFGELVLDWAETIVAMRPIPVALILGAERILLRADQRVYAWQSRADNAIQIATLPDQHILAQAQGSPEDVQMLGFAGDRLHYRVGSENHELTFLSLPLPSAIALPHGA
jgi:uncharacterized protein (TIGR02996 family)